ncbi:hypothetical protein [Holdemanella porci]|uniref:hypothetical protein n=1 Tax=Holdemanella porci TaxID=2652276 RepID=UPI003AB88660
MRCDNCYWNPYCSQAEHDLNINGDECDCFDDIDNDGEYLPTRERFYEDFYNYVKEYV